MIKIEKEIDELMKYILLYKVYFKKIYYMYINYVWCSFRHLLLLLLLLPLCYYYLLFARSIARSSLALGKGSGSLFFGTVAGLDEDED